MSTFADANDHLMVVEAADGLSLRAANDEALGVMSHEQVAPAGGWDPFEVWARRVRDARHHTASVAG